jgi:hypothetical protein
MGVAAAHRPTRARGDEDAVMFARRATRMAMAAAGPGPPRQGARRQLTRGGLQM